MTILSDELVAIVDPSKTAPERRLVQREDTLIKGFESGRLWMSNSPEWQKFTWLSLEISAQAPAHLTGGTVTQPCGKGAMYLVGPHFLWSSMTEEGRGLVLCDISSGRQLGALDVPGPNFVSAVNADGSLAVVTSKRTGTPRFWFVGENRTTDIKGALDDVRFAGPHTVVGISQSRVVVLDALSGARVDSWTMHKKERILAADAQSQRVLVAGNGARLHDLQTGNVLAEWPEVDLRSAAFGDHGLLIANDEERIRVWQLPSSEPIAELFVDSSGYVLMLSNGKFEATVQPSKLRELLTCTKGPKKLPVEQCAKALREPGLMALLLAQKTVK